MKRADHIAIEKIVLGYEFPDVHKWIDSKYPIYRGFKHWKHYHHIDAIDKKYRKGSYENKSAQLHVLIDIFSRFGVGYIPQTEEDLIKFLKYFNVNI